MSEAKRMTAGEVNLIIETEHGKWWESQTANGPRMTVRVMLGNIKRALAAPVPGSAPQWTWRVLQLSRQAEAMRTSGEVDAADQAALIEREIVNYVRNAALAAPGSTEAPPGTLDIAADGICVALYDRFVMGGWEAKDAVDEVKVMLTESGLAGSAEECSGCNGNDTEGHDFDCPEAQQ